MLCLFCKCDTTGSRSVEHIIPESLGNTRSTLPPGVVCDRCNNYFARKVEKPLLESIDLASLRFHQRIPSKRGRIPPLDGTIGSSAPATMYLYNDGPFMGSLDVSSEAAHLILHRGANVLNLPASGDDWNPTLTSRFLAKVALEGLASRLLSYCGNTDYVVAERQLDPIREYARRGRAVSWPYHRRRIYDADRRWVLPNGEAVQRVWEWEILETEQIEHYFIVALFGLELTINYHEPDIRGYIDWLKRHGGVSPLYYGQNARHPDNGILRCYRLPSQLDGPSALWQVQVRINTGAERDMHATVVTSCRQLRTAQASLSRSSLARSRLSRRLPRT
jgi:HNH endonuclease